MGKDTVATLVSQVTRDLPRSSVLTLRYVAAAPRVQRRVKGVQPSERLIEQARAARLAKGTPFWHALFLLGEEGPGGVPVDIVRSALYHQDPSDDHSEFVSVDRALPDTVTRLASEVVGKAALAIDSRVRLPNDEIKYIPMLDFSVKSEMHGGSSTARTCVEALGEPGWLVSSGRSFHFYGSRLVSATEQLDFWAKALLLTPIVDERWIAHQIRGGRAALRISPNEKGEVPAIIWDISNPA